MRGAFACVALWAALAGCTDAGEDDPPDPWAHFERAYGSSHAVNDEYRIEAEFPPGRVVCVSDAATHIHGFHQFLEGDCSAGGPPAHNRVMKVWADYNAAEQSRDDAIELVCADKTRRDVLEVTAPAGRGWTASCRERGDDGKEQFIVVFLHKDEARDGFGPDNIDKTYTMRLYTDAAHREADLEVFATFLGRLKLAGTSLTLGG